LLVLVHGVGAGCESIVGSGGCCSPGRGWSGGKDQPAGRRPLRPGLLGLL